LGLPESSIGGVCCWWWAPSGVKQDGGEHRRAKAGERGTGELPRLPAGERELFARDSAEDSGFSMAKLHFAPAFLQKSSVR
jgi:hypothetical protein